MLLADHSEFPGGFLLLFPILIILAFALHYYSIDRGRKMLDRWAQAAGYQLLEAEYRSFLTGRFFWTHSKAQVVYRIRAVDASGLERTGWARCGSWSFGTWVEKVSVKWDDGSSE